MRKYALVVLAAAIGMATIPASAQPPANQSPADQEVLARGATPQGGYEWPGIVAAFEQAIRSVSASGGVADVSGCKTLPKRPVYVTGTNLRKWLDSMVKADPRYRWIIEDGVVDLMPARGAPPILKVRIASFEVANPAEKWRAGDTLLHLPEVRAAAARLGLLQGGILTVLQAGVAPGQAPPKPMVLPPLHLRNVTVLSALNAIVRANPSSTWIFHESSCQGRGTFDVSFSQ